MDFFSIFGTLWRHKWVSIPLVLLTLLGMGYVLALRPPTYQAKADILLPDISGSQPGQDEQPAGRLGQPDLRR
jgi:uncharacterized protein involved in exopolysaccharide biosynthesis